ncbi:MAG: hypothetical protein AB7U27_10915 [Aminobacteriaceae bacterium]|jgi:hypothetical protein
MEYKYYTVKTENLEIRGKAWIVLKRDAPEDREAEKGAGVP